MAKLRKNKELNLLTALDRRKQRKKVGGGAVVAIAFAAAVAAAVFLHMQMLDEIDRLTERRDTALAYVDNPEIQNQYSELSAARQDVRTAQVRADALASAAESIDSYPDLTGNDLKTLFDIAGGNIHLSGIAYDRAAGKLSFGAGCESATHIPVFIAALRSSGIFSDVNYDGYSGSTRTEAGNPETAPDGTVTETQITVTEYSFNVSCVVNTDEQRSSAQMVAEPADGGQ